VIPNTLHEGIEPVAGIVFIPAYIVTGAVSTILAAGVTDGLVVPGTLVTAFSLMGMYVWRFTRRADRVLVQRIAELESERNYHRADAAYYRTWALTGRAPEHHPPDIHDYQPKAEEA
jgi:hypothetical protein